MLLLMMTLACRGCGPGEPEPSPVGEHHEAVVPLRDAVERGDAAARELCSTVQAPTGEGWGEAALERADDLHLAVGFCVASEDTLELGEAVGAIAGACGGCHRASGQGPTAEGMDLLARPAPPHAAATDRLWAVVVAGDEAATAAARQALAEDPALAELRDALLQDAGDDALGVAMGACAACHAARGIR